MWSKLFPSKLLIAMLLYLSESDKFTLDPLGIGIILAHINDGEQKPCYTIDVYNKPNY